MSEEPDPTAAAEPQPNVPIMPPAMPAAIAKAVVQVMKGIQKLEKGELNKHASYNFASIDDFLEATRPLCAEAGLIIVQQEEDLIFRTRKTKAGEGVWLVIDFGFYLFHEGGDAWAYRLKRTGMVDASMGSQALGASQSYALKQLMRSLFQIATGDKEDVDYGPGGKRAAPEPNPEYAMHRAEDWAAMLEAAADMKALMAVVKIINDNVDNPAEMPLIAETFNKKKAEFKAAADKPQVVQESQQGRGASRRGTRKGAKVDGEPQQAEGRTGESGGADAGAADRNRSAGSERQMAEPSGGATAGPGDDGRSDRAAENNARAAPDGGGADDPADGLPPLAGPEATAAEWINLFKQAPTATDLNEFREQERIDDYLDAHAFSPQTAARIEEAFDTCMAALPGEEQEPEPEPEPS